MKLTCAGDLLLRLSAHQQSWVLEPAREFLQALSVIIPGELYAWTNENQMRMAGQLAQPQDHDLSEVPFN